MSASSSESVKPSIAAHLFMSTNAEIELAASCAAMATVGGLTTLHSKQFVLKTPYQWIIYIFRTLGPGHEPN